MKSCAEVGLLLVLLACIGLSQQSSCQKQEYGNCDPGPDCDYWDNSGDDKTKCFNCCDDVGYITWDKVGDGPYDCRSGADEDERYSDMESLRSSMGHQCLKPKANCSKGSECCSGVCNDEKCWDERCS